ncbi:hypothetical protein K435DRAFT_814120, partial [Dendrothele bispora CBS 962.96]
MICFSQQICRLNAVVPVYGCFRHPFNPRHQTAEYLTYFRTFPTASRNTVTCPLVISGVSGSLIMVLAIGGGSGEYMRVTVYFLCPSKPTALQTNRYPPTLGELGVLR